MAGELSPPVELQLGRTAAGPHGQGSVGRKTSLAELCFGWLALFGELLL